jgi:hypothetical protein
MVANPPRTPLLVALPIAALLGAAAPAAAAPPAGEAPAPSARASDRRGPKPPRDERERLYLEMSPLGARAAGVAPRRAHSEDAGAAGARAPGAPRAPRPEVVGGTDVVVHGPGDLGLQSETSIASNATGTILVAGYNDARGFDVVPLSLSGVARSTDGGATWNEVPVGPGGLGVLPSVADGSVFGDPDVKYDPTTDRFVYSSIYVRPSDGLQGMSIHYSNSGPDAGSSWTGPVEVDPAFIAGHAADKEFIDVNPVTGRILMSWTDFGPESVKILASFSDDLGDTWSPAATLVTAPSGGGVQSSVPRFLPGTNDADSAAYVVWRNSAPSTGLRNVGCARSLDGGATWSAAVNLDSTSSAPEDQILGVDRVNTSPAMAIDHDTDRVYVVYQRNDSMGTGDVALRTFTGACAAGVAVQLNSHPGSDRAQFYPSVAVDPSSGRVTVFWYDQDLDPSGDRTELMHTSSTDQGASWSPPAPLFDRSFHAGHGNDTSQPNLGDYLQAVADDGVLHTLAASTGPEPRFDEGQPSSFDLIGPDAHYDRREAAVETAPLRIAELGWDETLCAGGSNGSLDPGESASLSVTVENYVANETAGATTVDSIAGTLTSSTPGVTIHDGSSAYSPLSPLASSPNLSAMIFSLAPSYVPGVPARFVLALTSDAGSVELPFEIPTGTPDPTPTTLVSETFETGGASNLPAGWTASHGAGTPTIAWKADSSFVPGTRVAYHAENPNSSRWERLFSPVVVVPTPAPGVESYLELEMDVTYDLEEEPSQAVLAYDGMFLRITDQTPGATLRSVLAEAFAASIDTAGSNHYPRHLPRSSDTNYFEDMSVWSGFSDGTQHVKMRFPGSGTTGRTLQLRFEYTEDGSVDCEDLRPGHTCGVAVDNVVLRHVELTGAACVPGPLFADDFESADACAWSSSVPDTCGP